MLIMKTRIEKLLVGAVLMGVATLVQAQFNYTNNGNGTCTITGYTGPGGAVSIPNSIAGLTVVSIGNSAFGENSSLASVTIPGSVTSIGNGAFYHCTGLTAITVDPANSFYSSANGVLFDKNQTTLIQFPAGQGGSYAIPASVTSIGNYAFLGCSSLTSVTIPNSVTSIGDNAFYYCTSLTSAAIPDSVTNIGGGAFAKCTSLTNVTIPNSVTKIGADAFCHCFSLTNVAIPANVTSIGSEAFGGCSLTVVTIPAGVTSIGYGPFSYCGSLTAITVDPANSFYRSVDGVLFDKNQTTLIQFPGRRGGNYTIPASVTSIGSEAFEGCTSLTSISIPASVTNIGDAAFWYCTSLASVTIPASVTGIGYEAFYECTRLTSVTIPDSVTSIGDNAFGACYNLTAAYFLGNAPPDPGDVFDDVDSGFPDPVIIYYLPGATGWGPFFSGAPTELWNPQASALRVTGGHFGFDITGPSNTVIVVEACTNLAQPVWLPVSTNALDGSGASTFSDSESAIYPAASTASARRRRVNQITSSR
jgi:hypothetical protein